MIAEWKNELRETGSLWRFCRSVILAVALLLCALRVSTKAQSTISARPPCDGQFVYVVRDAKTGQVVSRGWTTSRGNLPPDLVLGANRTFTISLANGSGLIGAATFTTGPDGSTTDLPKTQVGDSIAPDSDGDGVPDDIEDVLGTDPHNPSTQGNGVSDKALINNPGAPGPTTGLSIANNPAFGPPGIISSVLLPGNTVDISTFNNMAAVACLGQGVVVFNIFGGFAPRQIAVVDTPGEARAVGPPNLDLAVADGPAGLAVIDLRDPANARIRFQTHLASYAESVTTLGGTAFVGLRNGQLCTVDLASGSEIQRLNLGAEVFDVTVGGDNVWAVSGNTLRSFSFSDGILSQVGSVPLSSIGPDPLSGRKRLFVGGGWAQISCMSGFDNVDVHMPSAMTLVGKAPVVGPGSFKQIIADGSGLGLAAVGVNPRAGGLHNVNLMDLSNPANDNNFLITLLTPGTAYANSLYNGLDYVADGEKGLDVLRYKETDTKGVPPAVTLQTSAIAGVAEEGKLFRLTANATDDQQVRNVELYVDGQLIGNDGNFPFELFFNTPLRVPGKESFTALARAFDMGGNATWSDPVTVQLGPDITPPQVARSLPAANTILGSINSVIVFFSEPLRPDSVVPDAFRLVNAGADGILGTADDLPAPPDGVLTYQESLRAAVWTFNTPLAPGLWRGLVTPPIADRAGNILTRPYRFNFVLFNQPDRDHDGVPDALEPLLGLDPDNPDSKGDGIRDGDRDFDNDGLSNAAEVILGTNPMNPDTNGNGILDGKEDTDKDGLTDGQEAAYGTNPLLADSDGDGWLDGDEVTAGSDPNDPNDKPKLFFIARPSVRFVLPEFSPGPGGSHLLIIAQPKVSISLPVLSGPDFALGPVVAQPPVHIGLANFLGTGVGFGTVVAQPPVHIGLSALGTSASPLDIVIGHPPVKIKINSQ